MVSSSSLEKDRGEKHPESATATATASRDGTVEHVGDDDERMKESVAGKLKVDQQGGAGVGVGVGGGGKEYLTGAKLFAVFVGMLLSVFLFALDQTIVATAQPKIVSQFDALDQIAWVSSAYFLTQAGLMLTVGQILTITSTKLVFLVSIGIFELGSLFCGVAPNMNFLIFGRAVAGSGAAGMFTAILSIVAEVTRLEDRPILFGSFGAVFAVASVVGPLLGGVFTDHVSWRWCFYINLPFGAITVLSVMFLLHTPPGSSKTSIFSHLPLWKQWLSLDWIGTVLALGFVTALILALQWGGNSKPWNDADVIATLVVSGVVLVMFAVWEWKLGERAMLPMELLRRRTQVGCAIEGFFLFCLLLLGTYYLPLWYQARGASASRSGVNILAYMLAVVVAAGGSGAVISKTGRYWPFLFLSPLLASVGAGLLFTIHPFSTPTSRLIGFQIIMGVGVGAAMQNTTIAVQAEYAHEEELIPQGTSVLNFLQVIGGVIGITIGSAIFGNQLATSLKTFAPNLSDDQFIAVRSSVTAIFQLPKDLQPGVIDAYSFSLNRVFLIGVPAGALASLSSWLVKNYNLKERSPTGGMGGGGV